MNLIDRVKAMWNLFASGELTKADKWILVLAFLYCVSPVDVIPDVVPVLGFLDDLLLVLATLRHFSKRAVQEKPEPIPVKVTVS